MEVNGDEGLNGATVVSDTQSNNPFVAVINGMSMSWVMNEYIYIYIYFHRN